MDWRCISGWPTASSWTETPAYADLKEMMNPEIPLGATPKHCFKGTLLTGLQHRATTLGDTISKYQRHSHCYHLLLCWVPTLYIETASSFLTTAFKHLPLNVLQPPLWFTSEEIWNKQYIHLFYVLANCFLNSQSSSNHTWWFMSFYTCPHEFFYEIIKLNSFKLRIK